MKIILISDTHGFHEQMIIPDGDILIHAGDISLKGNEKEIKAFLNWFSNLPHTYKIMVAGNHDWLFERQDSAYIQNLIPENIIYLNDSGTEIKGLQIWGSPVQPTFFSWAFNRDRGREIKSHWDLIPLHTDILITHGPPFGILDKTDKGMHVGCEELRKRVDLIKPKLHVFGHIHEAYGLHHENNTIFANASLLNVNYKHTNKAIVLEV